MTNFRQSPWRRAAGRLAAALLVLSFLLVAGALGLVAWRGHEISARLRRSSYCRALTEVGVHANQGDCTSKWDIGNGEVPIRFNSRGFRDPERKKRAPPGTLRVAVLGGSTVLGLGIPENQATIGWKTEELLRARGIHGVEVLNLSVEAFDIAKHVLRVPEYIATLAPDVLVVESLRDYKVIRDSALWKAMVRDQSGAPVRLAGLIQEIGWPMGLLREIFPSSVHWLQKSGYVWRVGKETLRARFLYSDEIERTEAMMKAQAEAIGRIRELCAGRCQVAAFFDPLEKSEERGSHDGAADEMPPLIKNLLFNVKLDGARKEQILKRTGVLMLDARGKLPGGGQNELFIGETRYYTAAGMERYAAALADSLQQAFSLKPSAAPTRRRK